MFWTRCLLTVTLAAAWAASLFAQLPAGFSSKDSLYIAGEPAQSMSGTPTGLTDKVHVIHAATVNAAARNEPAAPMREAMRLSVENLDNTPAQSRLLALSALPGVNFQTATGGTVRPIVRGLGGLRVATFFYGARIESQAWGEQHGIFIPEEGIDRVEVLRGASTVVDAPDALGGILRFIPIGPEAQIGRKSALRLTGHSNTQGFQSSIITRKRSERAYHAFSGGINRHGNATLPNGEAVENSNFRQFFAQGRFGYLRDWGTWDGAYTSAYNTAGLLGTAGWHQSGDHLITTAAHIQGQSGWIWHSTLTYQLNHRKEFEGSMNAEDAVAEVPAELDLSLRTTRLDLRGERSLESWKVLFGGQIANKTNENGPLPPGAATFLPNATVQEAGSFLESSWNRRSWKLVAAVRQDVRWTRVANKPDRIFPMLSGGIGIQYALGEQWHASVHASRKNRAPGLTELSAFGVHHCMSRVELGELDLDLETSHQLEFSLQRPFHAQWQMEWNSYFQRIDQFIYLAKSTDAIEGLPVYQFAQSNAEVMGMEWSGWWESMTNWHIKWALSWIRAVDHEGHSLPLIPPANARLECGWQHQHANGQMWELQGIARVSSEALLADAGVTTWWSSRIKTSVTANNLFNASYRTILSQLNNLGLEEPGRNLKFRVEWLF